MPIEGNRLSVAPSMRPPRNTGENGGDVTIQNREHIPSMRPPRNTGENCCNRCRIVSAGRPSMRPPRNTGENTQTKHRKELTMAPSMRPPRNTGENRGGWAMRRGASTSFNEAPAKYGGKRLFSTAFARYAGPSMRPPRNTGENAKAACSNRIATLPSMRPPRNTGENPVKDSTAASMPVLQ